MEENKIKILKFLCTILEVDIWYNIGFSFLGKEINLSEKELDVSLNELEKEHYISQASLKGHDNFKLQLTQKGYNAVQGAAE